MMWQKRFLVHIPMLCSTSPIRASQPHQLRLRPRTPRFANITCAKACVRVSSVLQRISHNRGAVWARSQDHRQTSSSQAPSPGPSTSPQPQPQSQAKAATLNIGQLSQPIAGRTGTWERLPQAACAMYCAGAVLGPLLDGLHSQNDVLHYKDPVHLHLSGFELETCWWVPLLFGAAGIIIGIGVPALDRLAASKPKAAPSWPAVLLCIACFAAQYGLSGYLDARLHPPLHSSSLSPTPAISYASTPTPAPATIPALASPFAPAPAPAPALTTFPSPTLVPAASPLLVPSPSPLLAAAPAPAPGLPADPALAINGVLAVLAALQFLVFDRTPSGALLSLLTAVCGPAVEVGLIQGLHLYHYSHPDWAGIPLWIAWVYAAGGPAVGNLGRRVWADLDARRA
ncbi:hypothetical protein V8C86DRAFT_530655 [Haematococcus lacustris]